MAIHLLHHYWYAEEAEEAARPRRSGSLRQEGVAEGAAHVARRMPAEEEECVSEGEGEEGRIERNTPPWASTHPLHKERKKEKEKEGWGTWAEADRKRSPTHEGSANAFAFAVGHSP